VSQYDALGSDAHAPLRVLQLTDLHFCARPGDILQTGVVTDSSLAEAIAACRARHGRFDLAIATGDLAQDPVETAYSRLHDRLAALPWPVYCLPGNHDDSELLYATLNGGSVTSPRTVVRGRWLIALLNSAVPDKAHGHLSTADLEALDETLSARRDLHALVCLHHHPVPSGSPWLDRIALDNPDDLFGVLDRHPQVRGVLWGHIHQTYEGRRGGVRLMGSPSTCVQFRPNTRQLEIDDLPPGFRWLSLHADGRIESGVELADEPESRTA
jgi:Icc protein